LRLCFGFDVLEFLDFFLEVFGFSVVPLSF